MADRLLRSILIYYKRKIVQEKTFSQPIIVSSAFCGIVFKKRSLVYELL